MKAITLALLLLVAAISGCTTSKVAAEYPLPSAKTVSIEVAIFDGENSTTQIARLPQGTSCLDALRSVARVKYKEYPFGSYIYEVNGLPENTGNSGKYWQYYVDGKLATVAMDRFKMFSDAKLEVRYERQNPAIK